MQSIILSLASRYALSTAEVIQEIESAFARQFSQWYRQEVMVFLREEMRLEIPDFEGRYTHFFNLGFSTSRRWSPIRLMLTMVTSSAMPG